MLFRFWLVVKLGRNGNNAYLWQQRIVLMDKRKIKSAFDLDVQNQHLESRIIVALERISVAFRVLLWNEGKRTSLSPIQIQILIFLLFHSGEKCKVGYLASEFNMTKATVSESVKTLLEKGLVSREPDPADTRSFELRLTESGRDAAGELSTFSQVLERPISAMPDEQKESFLLSLLDIIDDLTKSGVITVQRMCLKCRFFSSAGGDHYCQLLKKPLAAAELRVDCPEWQPPE